MEVFKDPALLILLSTRNVKILLNMRSILGVRVILRPSTHRVYNSVPFFARKISQTVPPALVGANYFRGEQLEYLRVPAVVREYIVRVLAVFRGFVPRILHVYAPSISGLDTACTPVLSALL